MGTDTDTAYHKLCMPADHQEPMRNLDGQLLLLSLSLVVLFVSSRCYNTMHADTAINKVSVRDLTRDATSTLIAYEFGLEFITSDVHCVWLPRCYYPCMKFSNSVKIPCPHPRPPLTARFPEHFPKVLGSSIKEKPNSESSSCNPMLIEKDVPSPSSLTTKNPAAALISVVALPLSGLHGH